MTTRLIFGDCRSVLKTLADESVHCIVSSPPFYQQRSYLADDHPLKNCEMGSEATPELFIAELVAVFREVRRILRRDGTAWINLADKRIGGQLQLIPSRLALALQADGWWLRSDIIWVKNAMPEPVKNRPASSYDHLFLMVKESRYWYSADAVREPNCKVVQKAALKHATNGAVADARRIGNLGTSPDRRDSGKLLRISNNAFANPAGRNIRDVWTIPTAPSCAPGSHSAAMPPALAERCIKAGCPPGGTVMDPFAGSGTTGLAADRLGRNALLVDLSGEYVTMAAKRVEAGAPLFSNVEIERNG